jgi:hypothetical protein
MMFSLRVFRFRSLERNRESDERRIALIQKVVRSAVSDAETEATGLRTRLAKARRSVIFLNAQIDAGEPDPSKLASLEQQILTAEQRLEQLKDHLLFLRSIEVAATRVPD